MIPDHLSDIDSVPNTLSCRTSIEAADAILSATIEDTCTAIKTLGDTTEGLTQSLVDFALAATIVNS